MLERRPTADTSTLHARFGLTVARASSPFEAHRSSAPLTSEASSMPWQWLTFLLACAPRMTEHGKTSQYRSSSRCTQPVVGLHEASVMRLQLGERACRSTRRAKPSGSMRNPGFQRHVPSPSRCIHSQRVATHRQWRLWIDVAAMPWTSRLGASAPAAVLARRCGWMSDVHPCTHSARGRVELWPRQMEQCRPRSLAPAAQWPAPARACLLEGAAVAARRRRGCEARMELPSKRGWQAEVAAVTHGGARDRQPCWPSHDAAYGGSPESKPRMNSQAQPPVTAEDLQRGRERASKPPLANGVTTEAALVVPGGLGISCAAAWNRRVQVASRSPTELAHPVCMEGAPPPR